MGSTISSSCSRVQDEALVIGLYKGCDHSGHNVPEGYYFVRSCAGQLGARRAAAQAGECLSISRIRGCSNVLFKQGILASCQNSF